MKIPELGFLTITGDISIEIVNTRIPKDTYPYLFLIMGPTGAGKSSFIEALAGESQTFSISKNQLAGFTQTVNAYRVENVIKSDCEPHRPVYLIDTPGFSDSKISEIEVMNMVRRWLEENQVYSVGGILFLTTITETRLRGSRRRTIDMLKQCFEPHCFRSSITFVTTMWDTVNNNRTRHRAESNFAQLRRQICQDFDSSICITQFINSQSSALQAMNRYGAWGDPFSQPTPSAFPYLYQDLHERIEGALQRKQIIETDLTQDEARSNPDLRDILEKTHSENHETLVKFVGQLIDFGPPPPGFSQAAQRLRKTIAADVTPAGSLIKDVFERWAQEPELLEETVPDEWLVTASSTEAIGRLNLSDTMHSAPSTTLARKGLLRRLLNVAKRNGEFKRKD